MLDLTFLNTEDRKNDLETPKFGEIAKLEVLFT